MTTAIVDLDFPASVAREFPREFPLAWSAIDDIVRTLPGSDFTALERHSPALKGYNWENYLRCSVARMVRVLRALSALPPGSRVLDAGSYFGNFALMCRRAGFAVDAVDSYRDYGAALGAARRVLAGDGVTVRDFADCGFDLAALTPGGYDAIVCAGVIEHIPHTPRQLLEALDQRLRRGGLLLIDTPNLAYIYNRQRLGRGESIFCPLPLQYDTEIPFEGHHREYTVAEVRWMLERVGHEVLSIETFNYSIYGAGRLSGLDAENYEVMARDATARELILAVSRRP
jgi:2-polyprenyl-3-methyl-5-hydroxy-6-metoxy-1,4-benzoquinol methylase